MATKKVKLSVDRTLRIEYPRPTISANIVPAMRTPDASFPLRVSVLAVEKDDDGQAVVVFEDGVPTTVKTLIERVKPEGKTTLCGLNSPYPTTWAYSLAHSIVVYFQGGNVKGRVYATTFALNYARPKLAMSKLFDSGYTLLIEMPVSKSFPATMGMKNSAWVIPIGELRNYALSLANATLFSDTHTEQKAAEIAAAAEPEIMEFEL